MNAKAMTTAKVQCTGDDPQCNIAMQNASAQCEQEGGGGEGGGEQQVRRIDNG